MKNISLLPCSCFLVLLLLSACTTANHGSFTASTFAEPAQIVEGKPVGRVTGESSQTYFLYAFPMGKSPSTSDAVSDAKSKIAGTKFLTDVSIDDKTYWGFGYRKQVIEVEATAYK
jgi:hypothetical protein